MSAVEEALAFAEQRWAGPVSDNVARCIVLAAEVRAIRRQRDELAAALSACEFFIVECGVNGAAQVLALARAALAKAGAAP